MLRLGFRTSFTARHCLIGGDFGPEGQPHAHDYHLEWELVGTKLNQHGFLVDLREVESRLKALVGIYQDAYLNDRPEFQGLNPSVEQFARVIWDFLATGMRAQGLRSMSVKLFEHERAWTVREGRLR